MSQSSITVITPTIDAATARVAINGALEALATLSSGATEPSTTFSYMLWADTANDILKMRTAADDAWINLFALDQGADTAVPSLITIDNTDDLSTDSATVPPSARAVRVLVDTEIAASGWQYAAAQATTSGTEFDFPSIPATANEIFIGFDKPSLTGGDDLLIQIGDSGGIEATGYVSSSERQTGNGQGISSSTAGFIAGLGNSSSAISGAMRLQRGDGNTWHETHSAALNAGEIINGGGVKVLSGTLDRVRVTRDGTDTFDAGSVIVGWRT